MKNKEIVFSVFIIGITLLLAGIETKAYFVDAEKSEENTLIAGILDVNISHSFRFGNVPPGTARKESMYVINNKSSTEIDNVYLEIDVTDAELSDDTEPERDAEILHGITNEAGTNRGETDISKWVQITKMRYNNVNILNLYTDLNNNDYIDFDDLNNAGQIKINRDDKLSPGEIAYVNFTMLFDPDAENELQGDTCIVDEIITVQNY